MHRSLLFVFSWAEEEEEEEEEEACSSYLSSAFRGSSGGDYRLRVRFCRLLERLLLWCHEFFGVWVFWCRSSYPLCASTAQPQFRVGLSFSRGLWGEYGYIYLDMSEHTCGGVRRHCSRGGTRHVTVLCSSSGHRLPCFSAEANPHGFRDSPVAVHLVVDVPVVQLQPVSQVVDMPVGVQRQVPGGFGVQNTVEVPHCRSSKFFNILVVAQSLFPMVLQTTEIPQLLFLDEVIDDPGVRVVRVSQVRVRIVILVVLVHWLRRGGFPRTLLCSGLHVAQCSWWDLLLWYSSHQLHWYLRASPCGLDCVQFPHCLYGRPSQQRRWFLRCLGSVWFT